MCPQNHPHQTFPYGHKYSLSKKFVTLKQLMCHQEDRLSGPILTQRNGTESASLSFLRKLFHPLIVFI